MTFRSSILFNSVPKNTQAGSYTLTADDRGKIVEFTGAAASTFTLPSAVGVGSGWWCYLKNSGTALLTISGTLDGVVNPVDSPGTSRLIQSDGANFTSILWMAGTGPGTVTGVTGTAPVVSSGGATPAISMPAATNAAAGYATAAHIAAIEANTAKVTNATHTGDATGATALTVVAINGVALSGLATGILRNTTTTGVPSIAIAADFPTLNQSTTGNAATVTTNANLTGVVTSTGNATAIADAALSIAKTSGLQTALDAKASLSAAQTFTGGQRGAVTALTSSAASIAINLATNNNFSHTTSENSTLAAPSNPVAGQSGIITITQGATARTLAYNTFWKFAGGTVPTLTATASAVDAFAYYVESATRATCQLIKDVK